jgi:hypothetical protein
LFTVDKAFVIGSKFSFNLSSEDVVIVVAPVAT